MRLLQGIQSGAAVNLTPEMVEDARQRQRAAQRERGKR